MKSVFFKRLEIHNFKGIKELATELNQTTTISGANGTGKTTIADAIVWGLFNKNSQNESKFSIKNQTDKSLNKADHSVELTILVDGQPQTAKRVYREKWTKRKGKDEIYFEGHETELSWNGVPCTETEYKRRVAEICPEEQFRLITDPYYFNSTLKKEQRRDHLIKMATNITDEDVAKGNKVFEALLETIRGQKTLEGYKKELAASKTMTNKKLATIPARIDERLRSNPTAQNWDALRTLISLKAQDIKTLNGEIGMIANDSKEQLQAAKELQTKKLNAVKTMGDIREAATLRSYAEAQKTNKRISDAKFTLGNLQVEIKTTQERIDKIIKHNNELETEVAKLRIQYEAESEKEIGAFNREDFKCPTCQRKLEAETIDAQIKTLTANFAALQEKTLDQIELDGIAKQEEIKHAKKTVETLTNELEKLKVKAAELEWSKTAVQAIPESIENELKENAQFQELKAISETVVDYKAPDTAEQKQKVETITNEIKKLEETLKGEETIASNQKRITELQEEQRTLSQEIAGLEKTEMIIEQFGKEKMLQIEKSINNRFKLVRFKLFDLQINGGEVACCETMVDGVPYQDLNHGGQLNAGVDCINAFSDSIGIIAPIIVDNAESINHILPTEAQLIRLAVTTGDLTID